MNLALAIPHATRSVNTPALDSNFLDDRLSALSHTYSPILQQLRSQYATACLSADLVQIHQDQFVVRAVVLVDTVAIVTALASAATIEVAEDRARMRVLEALGLNRTSVSEMAPIVSKLVATVPEPTIASEDEADQENGTEVEITAMSQVSEVEVAEPIGESILETPVLEALALDPIVEPIVSIESVPPTELDATEPAIEPDEAELIDTSSEVEEVYEYTYEGEEIPVEPTAPIEVVSDSIEVSPAPIDYGLDLSDVIAQIGMEIDRIGWTKKQGSAYLQATYHKRTRAELTETELFSFLSYLKSLPAKVQPQLSHLPF